MMKIVHKLLNDFGNNREQSTNGLYSRTILNGTIKENPIIMYRVFRKILMPTFNNYRTFMIIRKDFDPYYYFKKRP